MEFSNKKLQKAFEYYEQGKYKEALKICSKVLNKEYNNEDALTLEGEVLFKCGRIDDAIITWKINAEYNNNELAKKHLARIDSGVKEMALSYTSIYSEDEEYKRLIIDAYRESKKEEEKTENKEQEPIENKEKTENESNKKEEKEKNKNDETVKDESIKVTSSNSKSESVETKDSSKSSKEDLSKNEVSEKDKIIEKEPEVEKTVTPSEKVTINEVTPVEKESVEEKVSSFKEDVIKEEASPVKEEKINNDVKKEEVSSDSEPKVDVIKRESSNELKRTRVEKHCNAKNSFNKKIVAVIVAAVIVIGGGVAIYKNSPSKPASEKPKVEVPKIDWSNFNSDVQTAINNQNYPNLYALLTQAPENKIPQAEQASYQAGLKAMDENGVQYFYDQGMNYYNQKQYQQAIDSFQKGLKFAQNNYLAPHLTYFIGASYSGLGDHQKAVEYYKLYLKNFPNDDIYNSGCLYVLAKYYYAQGYVKEAQNYANQLQSKYPNSPYNNTDISNILNNK